MLTHIVKFILCKKDCRDILERGDCFGEKSNFALFRIKMISNEVISKMSSLVVTKPCPCNTSRCFVLFNALLLNGHNFYSFSSIVTFV